MATAPTLDEFTHILHRHLPSGYSAVLFGSRATGRARPRSDWDIGVLGPQPLPSQVMGNIREEFEALPTLHTIDLVDLTTTPDYFRKIALKKVIRLT